MLLIVLFHNKFVYAWRVQWFAIRSSNTKSQSLHETNHCLFLFPCTQKRLRLVIQAAGWDMPCKYIKWKHETFFPIFVTNHEHRQLLFRPIQHCLIFSWVNSTVFVQRNDFKTGCLCNLCDNWTQQVAGLVRMNEFGFDLVARGC